MAVWSDGSFALRLARFSVGLLALASFATVAAAAQQLPLTIGAYHLQSSVRVSPTQYDYTYTADIFNSGVTAMNVMGTVVSSSPNTLVTSGTVSFGLVPGNSTITGTATFTIRQNRLYPFDPSSLSWTFSGTATRTIFERSLISRLYEGNAYTEKSQTGGADRETVAQYAAALAGLAPSYVSGLIYLNNSQTATTKMISDFNTVRSAVLAVNPNAKFDVELSLNPAQAKPYANAAAVVAVMTTLDAQFHPDSWNFDFWSNAFNSDPDWVAAAVAYAHAHNQLVGGNVFGKVVPTGSDFVSFVDDPVAGSTFGFDFSTSEITNLQASSPSTILIGHLQTNAQNGPTTESNVYQNQWSESTRAAYLNYWASSQTSFGFTFMYPVFYPLFPANFAFDPLLDSSPSGGTLYSDIGTLMSTYNP
jgi:hypothetical protein